MNTSPKERLQSHIVRALIALPDAIVRRLAGSPRRNRSGAVLDARVQLLGRLRRLIGTPWYEDTVEHARQVFESELRTSALGHGYARR